MLENIGFRIKEKYQILVNEEAIVCKGVSDKYSIGFIKGLTFTNNCYSCIYASAERVSDITIGDSWGSKLNTTETKKGVSLMLVQTDKGKSLLERADIELIDVDKDLAVARNSQLRGPMKMPEKRGNFFVAIRTKNINKQIFKMYTKDCLKQDVKCLLVKMGLAH